MVPKNYLPLIAFVFLLGGIVPAASQEASDTAPDPSNDQEIDLQFQVGLNAYNRGELNEAHNRFRRAAYGDTVDPRAKYWLAKTYLELGQNDSATKVLKSADTTSRVTDWYEEKLQSQSVLYDTSEDGFSLTWDYLGLVEGKKFGEERHITPSALVASPEGGWLSTSFKMGKLSHYSEEGKFLKSWKGLDSPTDILVHPEIGILVTEMNTDRVQLLSDTQGFVTFADAGIHSPTKIMNIKSSVFVFNSSTESIMQLSTEGETVGQVWEPKPGMEATDVTLGPGNRFWVLDDRSKKLHVIDRRGIQDASHSYGRNLDLSSIWWRSGHLLAVSEGGLLELSLDNFEPEYLSVQGDTVPGNDVSNLILSGDRLIVSAFESSQFLLYRQPEPTSPDMIVNQRRIDFSDFPLIRINVQLDDPIRSRRFERLGDNEFGISVENQERLPSLLRHSGEVYGKNWIMIVDNRIEKTRRWEEIRPFLESIINNAPGESEGSIWKLLKEDEIAQNYTPSRTLLENSLNRLNIYSSNDESGTNSLSRLVNQGFTTIFSKRDPGAIILISNHLNNTDGRFRRIANRSMNGHHPLIVINPSYVPLSESHPFKKSPTVRTMNLRNLNHEEVWRHYRRALRHHYSAIYRSGLSFQPSSLWRDYELRFYYFDRTRRHNRGFMFP